MFLCCAHSFSSCKFPYQVDIKIQSTKLGEEYLPYSTLQIYAMGSCRGAVRRDHAGGVAGDEGGHDPEA